MPLFDEGGNTGAARSNVLDVIVSIFDKDRRKPLKKSDEQDGKDEQAKKGSKWF